MIELGGRVLAIDDEQSNLDIIEEIFSAERYELEIALSAEQGLLLFEQQQPDVILLDIMMPGINGYECCRQLRELEPAMHTKIIMVTGKAMVEERVIGYEAGADDYFTKPFFDEELIAKVNVYLRLAQTEKALYELNQHLEQRVKFRTEKLEASNKMLKNTLTEFRRSYTHSIRMFEQLAHSNERRYAALSKELAEHMSSVVDEVED